MKDSGRLRSHLLVLCAIPNAGQFWLQFRHLNCITSSAHHSNSSIPLVATVMRLKRSRRSAAAIADETEDSHDTTSVEAASEEDDSSQDLTRRTTGVRKHAAQKRTGLYAEDSVEDSVVKSSSEEDETEYQVQDNVLVFLTIALFMPYDVEWAL